VGSVEIRTSLPAPATQRALETQAIAPTPPRMETTSRLSVQVAFAAVGLVETRMSPMPSATAQSELDAQEAALKLTGMIVLDSTVRFVQLGLALIASVEKKKLLSPPTAAQNDADGHDAEVSSEAERYGAWSTTWGGDQEKLAAEAVPDAIASAPNSDAIRKATLTPGRD
jgi:hypothetical protein